MSMSTGKTLTFVLMDAPFESARTTTAFCLIQTALAHGHVVNVFAYEGAVALAFAQQKAHPNAVHGCDVQQENHPLPSNWIKELIADAAARGTRLDWVNCGLCVDERGVNDAVGGTRRGSPVDLWKMAQASDNVLVIATK
jgi:tRNA 2-thiouridine synthesizing protein D